MNIPSLNDKWKEVERILLDQINAGPVQRREMKRAFFMGAQAFYYIQMEHVSALPDDEAEAAMKSLDAQLRGFNEAVKLGAA